MTSPDTLQRLLSLPFAKNVLAFEEMHICQHAPAPAQRDKKT